MTELATTHTIDTATGKEAPAELSTERVNGGNPELRPQRAWETLATVERTILGDGLIRINPPSDAVIGPGDEILVVAEDNDTYTVNGAEAPDDGALLLVTVEEGDNFPNLDVLDDSDSFVTLQLPGASEVQRTSTKENSGEAPVWRKETAP